MGCAYLKCRAKTRKWAYLDGKKWLPYCEHHARIVKKTLFSGDAVRRVRKNVWPI